MKKQIFAIAIAAIAFGAHAQRVSEYEINAGNFDKIEVLDNINIVYLCNPDSTGFIRYTASDLVAESLVVEMKGKSTLKIRYAKYSPAKELTDFPTLYVYSDFLTQVKYESEGTMAILHPQPVPTFNVALIGNGSIVADGITATNVNANISTGCGTMTLSGKCTNAKYSMVGAGNIQADMLQANIVKCMVSGTGSVGVWALDKLTVNNAGSTKVFYKGDPQIKVTGKKNLTKL